LAADGPLCCADSCELSFVWPVTARISKVLTNPRFDLLQQIDRVLFFPLPFSSSFRLSETETPHTGKEGDRFEKNGPF